MTDCAENVESASVPIAVVPPLELGRPCVAPWARTDVTEARSVRVVAPPVRDDEDVWIGDGSGGAGSTSAARASSSGEKGGSGAGKVENAGTAAPSSATRENWVTVSKG